IWVPSVSEVFCAKPAGPHKRIRRKKNPLRFLAGDFESRSNALEVDTRVDKEAAHSAIAAGILSAGQCRDAAERPASIDRGAWRTEIRMVQDVDCIDMDF